MSYFKYALIFMEISAPGYSHDKILLIEEVSALKKTSGNYR